VDFKNIAIIGIGLIGGSFALAVRKQGFQGKISGVGRNLDNLKKARDLGMIDKYSSDPAEGVKGADLILLATPVGEFQGIVEKIKRQINPGTVVSDVGSVKREILNRLEPLMPDGVQLVGAHPIAGKECPGISAASADLFNGHRCIITPSEKTDKNAIARIARLWEWLGARVSMMPPDEHDMIFAAVSHMPHVVAYAMVNAITEIREDILRYGGSGLRDMTRIALSPVGLWRDICVYNSDSVLRTLRRFSSSLSRAIELIERSDWAELEKEFANANRKRHLIEPD
jgi:prephenate dehydrogenase